MQALCHLHDLRALRGKNEFGPFSLRIKPGERIAILGPSGAGKTTLLQLIAGDLRSSSGSYDYQGVAMHAWSLYDLSKSRAVLPQSGELAFGLPVELVIALGRIARVGDSHLPEIITQAARIAHCEHLLKRGFDSLSGGEKARVHLARVFAQLWDACDGLLLVDEPLASLDPGLQMELLSSMKQFASTRNHAMVAILHDINQAMQHFDRLILVKEAKIVGDHVAGMGAIADLADLYHIRLDVVRMDGRIPLVFPRARCPSAF